MVKSYIDKAFRIVPVHPTDYKLLDMKTYGQYYYDRSLPVGCSISCKYRGNIICSNILDMFKNLTEQYTIIINK